MPPALAGCRNFHSANNTLKNPQPWLCHGGRRGLRKAAGLPTLPHLHCGLGCIFFSFALWAVDLLGSDIPLCVLAVQRAEVTQIYSRMDTSRGVQMTLRDLRHGDCLVLTPVQAEQKAEPLSAQEADISAQPSK